MCFGFWKNLTSRSKLDSTEGRNSYIHEYFDISTVWASISMEKMIYQRKSSYIHENETYIDKPHFSTKPS